MAPQQEKKEDPGLSIINIATNAVCSQLEHEITRGSCDAIDVDSLAKSPVIDVDALAESSAKKARRKDESDLSARQVRLAIASLPLAPSEQVGAYARVTGGVHSVHSSREESGVQDYLPRDVESALPVAEPVVDKMLPQAYEFQSDQGPGRDSKGVLVHRRRSFYFVGFLFALGAPFIVAPIIWKKVEEQQLSGIAFDNGVAFTRPLGNFSIDIPEEERLDLLIKLPDYTQATISKHPSSPQGQAFDWMLKDPHLAKYSRWRVEQRFALATFFYATGGGSNGGWVQAGNWTSYDNHECDWFSDGMETAIVFRDRTYNGRQVNLYDVSQLDTCLCVDDKYKYLVLVQNDLDGTLPPELSLLSSLQLISTRNNYIHGSIPTEIGLLSDLFFLDFSSNEITGPIPTEIGNLSNLSSLFGWYNDLSGSIPSEIGYMSSLEHLVLETNTIEGSLPSEIGNLVQLKWLILQNNPLTGTIPTEVGNLRFVTDIGLFENSLMGPIPTELGLLTSLLSLGLGCNELSGPIPTQIGNLSNLVELGIWDAKVSGTIPTEVGLLTKLAGIVVPKNAISGVFPSEIGLLPDIIGIAAFSNRLTGSIPTELGSLQGLLGLLLGDNELTGIIPSELGMMRDLEKLSLPNNRLTSTIPQEIGHVRAIKELDLANNELSGTIPSNLGLLFQESGSWVEAIFGMHQQQSLAHTSMVIITWNIDIMKTGLPQRNLNLGNNRFSGTIPTELGNASTLRTLELEHNYLAGALPFELTKLVELALLNVSGNSLLEGTIPEGLCAFQTDFDCSKVLCGCGCTCRR